jgi:sporulation protein YlmC with PRC-barrel domain
MRLKELRGLPVIDPTAARKVGIVFDYQVDPVSRRLAALDINPMQTGEGERIAAQRIRRVGRNAVILTERGGSGSGTTPDINEGWLDTSTLVGLEVMGDDGNRVGRLVDATFNQDSLEIDAYLLHASLWERLLGRRGRIQPPEVHACSRELMMVTTGHLKEVTAPSPEDTTSPLGLTLPLKPEDRLPAPSYEPVADGQAVGTRRR